MILNLKQDESILDVWVNKIFIVYQTKNLNINILIVKDNTIITIKSELNIKNTIFKEDNEDEILFLSDGNEVF